MSEEKTNVPWVNHASLSLLPCLEDDALYEGHAATVTILRQDWINAIFTPVTRPMKRQGGNARVRVSSPPAH
jgi:hypothetical protein